MNKRNKFSILLKAMSCVLLFSIVQAAQAAIVAPGGNAMLSGTTSAANPNLAGTVINDNLLPFQIQDSQGSTILTGNVQDRVVRSNNTGELIFAPRLRDLNNPTGDAWIFGLRLEGYGGFSTDIEFRTDGLGDVGPNTVTRSAGSVDQLFFSYDPNIIAPPDEGLFLSVATDATAFDSKGIITIFAQNDFGGNSFSTKLDGTASPVPIPAAGWLFGSALVFLVSRRTVHRKCDAA